MDQDQALVDKKKFKKAYKKAVRSAELEKKAELQMNSLMDIFVNVLIYLLMNYSTSPVDVSQTEERRLPESYSKLQLKHTTTLGVTTKAILVNRKKVCPLQDGRVDPALKKDKQAQSYLIVPLLEKLKEAASKRKKIAKFNKAIQFKGIVTIVADERMPFRLLSEIMYTAGQAEFGKFKFAVVRKAAK